MGDLIDLTMSLYSVIGRAITEHPILATTTIGTGVYGVWSNYKDKKMIKQKLADLEKKVGFSEVTEENEKKGNVPVCGYVHTLKDKIVNGLILGSVATVGAATGVAPVEYLLDLKLIPSILLDSFLAIGGGGGAILGFSKTYTPVGGIIGSIVGGVTGSIAAVGTVFVTTFLGGIALGCPTSLINESLGNKCGEIGIWTGLIGGCCLVGSSVIVIILEEIGNLKCLYTMQDFNSVSSHRNRCDNHSCYIDRFNIY